MPDHGEVWWGPAPFKSSAARPWLVISDERRPFLHAECIALAMTTQEYTEGITVPDDAWIEGGADVQSYISPWFVTTIKLRGFHDQQGTLSPDLVTQAVRRCTATRRRRSTEAGTPPCPLFSKGVPERS